MYLWKVDDEEKEQRKERSRVRKQSKQESIELGWCKNKKGMGGGIKNPSIRPSIHPFAFPSAISRIITP